MLISVIAKTNSRHTRGVSLSEDGHLVVSTGAKPVDGAANAEIIALLAKYFQVSKGQISIKRGASSKHKVVEVSVL